MTTFTIKKGEVAVKSVDFFKTKVNPCVKSWSFENPVDLDSTDFNDVTPIEGYDYAVITNDEGSELILNYNEIPYTK